MMNFNFLVPRIEKGVKTVLYPQKNENVNTK